MRAVRLRIVLPLVLGLVLSLALAGCAVTGGFRLRAPPPVGPSRPVALEGLLSLRLELPPAYELQPERGATFEVYHISRVPPRPIERDTELAIFVGRPYSSYCPQGIGRYEDAAFRSWRVRWHHCGGNGGQPQVLETHLLNVAKEPLHIFIVGPDPGEIARLRNIAETLIVRGG